MVPRRSKWNTAQANICKPRHVAKNGQILRFSEGDPAGKTSYRKFSVRHETHFLSSIQWRPQVARAAPCQGCCRPRRWPKGQPLHGVDHANILTCEIGASQTPRCSSIHPKAESVSIQFEPSKSHNNYIIIRDIDNYGIKYLLRA